MKRLARFLGILIFVSLCFGQVPLGTPQPIDIGFAMRPYAPRVGVPVQFTDYSSSVIGIVAWEWDFGDGVKSTLRNPVHTFTEVGDYELTLTVWGGDGLMATMTIEVLQGITIIE